MQKWNLRLEFESDQGLDGNEKLVIERFGEHDGEPSKRAVNECVAVAMQFMMKMLLESGALIGPSSFKETTAAFSGE